MSNVIKFYVNGFGYLTPKNDVTALEAVHLNLVIAVLLNDTYADVTDYVKAHNLERHFTQEVF